MGYGLGASLGAKVGRPEKTVVNIAGDGCFRMNMNEIATAARHNIPVIQVVINNHVLGMVRQWQNLFYGKRYSHTVLNDAVDFEEWKRLEADMRTLSEIYCGTNIIGSGGNINKLYRLAEKTDKKRQRISVIVLKSLYEKLKLLSFEERMQVFNLKPDRADVIVPASEIFLTIAEILHSEYIYVPVIGLADGIIDGLYAANRNR